MRWRASREVYALKRHLDTVIAQELAPAAALWWKSATMKYFLILAATALLSGCATGYGPRNISGGYSHTRIQNDVFTVLFDGNAYAHKSVIEYYALVRAAELTAQQGRQYMRIVGGDTDIKTSQIYMPGQTFVNTNTYGNYSGNAWATRYGNQANVWGTGNYSGNTYTTMSSTPGYATTLQKPIVTLTVLTLPRRIDPCLDARQVLQGALEKRLKLQPATIAALSRN